MNLNRRDAVSTLAEALQSLARWAFHRKIGQQIRVREYQEREYFSLRAQLRIGGAPLGSSEDVATPARRAARGGVNVKRSTTEPEAERRRRRTESQPQSDQRPKTKQSIAYGLAL